MTKLYKNYFNDLINLFPSINDHLNINEYSHLNHLLVQSNKEYNDQNSDLMKYLDVYNPRISPELMLEKVITDLIKKNN